ncbi:MAG TPA: glycosyltransferase family A protein [Solirubrobacterales bacterium]
MSAAAPDGEGNGWRILAPAKPGPVEPLSEPPGISVVIAAYQAAESIEEAARSALDQAHAAEEVIVVDDGSTDGTAEALRPLEREGLKVIRRPNGGVASARNAGLAAAKGEFVAFLDADDRYHPRRLEAMAELARLRPDLDLVSTDMRFLVDGEPAGTFLDSNEFTTEGQRAAILRSCFVGGLPAVRASRLHEIDGFDEGLAVGSDWDCWLRMILAGSRAGMVAEPLYDYLLHSGTLTSSRLRSLRSRVTLLEKASRSPSLRDAERPVLRGELRRRLSEVVEEEAATGQLEGRLAMARTALTRPLEPRARLVAAAAALAPSLGRSLGRSREAPVDRLGGSRA